MKNKLLNRQLNTTSRHSRLSGIVRLNRLNTEKNSGQAGMTSFKHLHAGSLLTQIRNYFKNIGAVAAVYLFGSAATGNETVISDIDIAVLLKPSVNPYKPIDIQLKIMADLEMLLKKRVDVVLLGYADPILEHQIRKYGIILLDKAPNVRIVYETDARKKYFDFTYRHDNYMKTLKDRILQAAR